MNIKEILQELDTLDYTKAETFLKQKMEQASKQGEYEIKITLLNEMIGFCRDTCQFEKAKAYCKEALMLLEEYHLNGTQGYATTLLNVANAYRAAGLLEESLSYYKQVLAIYDKLLSPDDFLFASLNNNLSLLYQEMGDFKSACDCLRKALTITEKYKEARIETAVTHTNLAQSLLRLNQTEEAKYELNEALSIFEQDEKKDYHYSAALSVLAEIEYMSNHYQQSAQYYEKAMNELAKHMGKNENYEILKSNRDKALEKVNQPGENIIQSGIMLCESYYQEIGVPMIHEKFGEYENRIAVGLVGEGSECFGFDDEISRDHDFGPGFYMWLTDQDYDKIGDKLQKEYDALPKDYMGFQKSVTKHGHNRCKVYRIIEYYEKHLGLNHVPKTENEWLWLKENDLATVSNGKVFRDDLGLFSSIRQELLSYYPKEVWLKKIATQLVVMGQLGQYNYARTLKRKDYVTARIILADYMKATMQMVYLLNRIYAPYYKWMHRGMKSLSILPEIMDILNAIEDMPREDERISMTIEIIAGLIIEELKKEKLLSEETDVQIDKNYLEQYGEKIMDQLKEELTNDELIGKLVQLEWEAFDKVKNEGGRANCQDDWNTFSIMRKSQYMEWTKEMLLSYINDFEEASAKGWNLITEKYGRMMETTTPDIYQNIKKDFPILSWEKKNIIEEIVKIQVAFMEDLASQYPKVAGTARSVHTYEDNPYNTSYETYLRGELSTYSDHTLELYGRFIVEYYRNGQNLAESIMKNTANLYGYDSLEELESRLE